MKLQYLSCLIQEYRRSFLKRKNINCHKCYPQNTPLCIEKILNSLDRKIKRNGILKDSAKIEYLDKLNTLFVNYYDNIDSSPRYKKTMKYYQYKADVYCLYGKKIYLSKCLSFQEFFQSGMYSRYRQENNFKLTKVNNHDY